MVQETIENSDIEQIRTQLQKQKYIVIVVKGTSMQGTVNKENTVIVEPVNKIEMGSVVVIESKGSLLIHRLVGKFTIGKDKWYIHKGDSSSTIGIAKVKDIIGLVKSCNIKNTYNTSISIFILFLRFGAFLSEVGVYPRTKIKALTGNLIFLIKKIIYYFI